MALAARGTRVTNGDEEPVRDERDRVALARRAVRIHIYALVGGLLFALWGYLAWTPPAV